MSRRFKMQMDACVVGVVLSDIQTFLLDAELKRADPSVSPAAVQYLRDAYRLSSSLVTRLNSVVELLPKKTLGNL